MAGVLRGPRPVARNTPALDLQGPARSARRGGLSADGHESGRRSPLGSVPATAHGGHTLHVRTVYGSWRNDANGEDSSDGESRNRNSSRVEGATDDEMVNARRDR